MRLIIESKTLARCVDTNKEFVITDLTKIKENNEIVEDKTKPKVKPKKQTFSSLKEWSEEK
jgi:hypothetical protein